MKKILVAGLTALLSTHSVAADAPAGPLAFPPIGNTLKANPKPLAIDAGPVGTINVGGVLSGLGYQQSNATATDDSSRLDISNAQLFITEKFRVASVLRTSRRLFHPRPWHELYRGRRHHR